MIECSSPGRKNTSARTGMVTSFMITASAFPSGDHAAAVTGFGR